MRSHARVGPGFLLIAIGLSAALLAEAQPPPHSDLTQLDLEDLLNLTVTSVSKREQTLSRTPAAVFVISQEDIRRSGATNIPDLLRMAPGVDVAQIDANSWAVSVRGFNARYSNKVLVLVDGRTVYTPDFSGVFWEHLDLPLDDIDRIEVIRGPGASVWGANAVNGVISIITKPAKATKGGRVTAGAGSELLAQTAVQYGGAAGRSGAYRVYGKFFDVGNSAMSGSPANDRWSSIHGGFRADWDLSPRDALMAQGSLFSNRENQTLQANYIATPGAATFPESFAAAGGDLLARWDHTLQRGGQTSFQMYYDGYRRSDMGVPESVRTVDFDFQDELTAGKRHNIVWGLGFRSYRAGLAPGYPIALSPASRTDQLFSGFVQDEIRLPASLRLTAGCRIDHNSYTGTEVEPSARLAWNSEDSRHTVWASVSKADRQPSRIDSGIEAVIQTLPLAPGMLQVMRLHGNPQIEDEELRDVEAGYRSQLVKTLSLDVAGFASRYRNLETVEPLAPVVIPGSTTVIEIPMMYSNKARAVDYGGEAFLSWNVASRWRISPGYSYLHATIRQDAGSQGMTNDSVATGFPQHTFQMRSMINLSRRVEFDQSVYYTARLPGAAIPGRTRLDLRLARRIGEGGELRLAGQNLLRARTLEFGDSNNVIGAQVQRSIYAEIAWRF